MNFKNKIKKILTGVLLSSLGFFFSVFAADPSGILVEVNPSSFGINTPVDLTISAVKSNWSDIEKTYVWSVMIEVAWTISAGEWILPNDWYYEFKASDQWVKTFSKWVEIKTPWTYKIKVYDILDETIQWEATIIVWWDSNNASKKNINISAPIQWSVERWSNVNVIWSSIDLPNSPYQIILNWLVVAQSVTTEKWDISSYVTWLKLWENTLQIKIISVDDIVLWQSDVVTFTQESVTDEFFKSITIDPVADIKQWDKVTFTIWVGDSVSSAEISFSNWKVFPMNKTAWSTFVKTMFIDFAWDIKASVNVISNWEIKEYNDVLNMSIAANTTVWEIKFVTDSLEKWSMTVMWSWVWVGISQYRVAYWTDTNNLSESVDVSTNEILLQNLDPEKLYYFQIIPLDGNWNVTGTPSAIVEAQPWHLSYDTTCVVKNIKVWTEKIWDKNYLVRNKVENATKYIVYRSEYDTQDMTKMNKVWEATENKFYYPFDNFAQKNEYAYYAVEAVCSDGNAIQIDNVKKVQVGPVENLVLFVVISLFLYSTYKLYSFSTKHN